jgi:hypothetical protein
LIANNPSRRDIRRTTPGKLKALSRLYLARRIEDGGGFLRIANDNFDYRRCRDVAGIIGHYQLKAVLPGRQRLVSGDRYLNDWSFCFDRLTCDKLRHSLFSFLCHRLAILDAIRNQASADYGAAADQARTFTEFIPA